MKKENNIPTVENLENTIPPENDMVLPEQEKVVYTERRCMRCQALLEEGQVFCPECGASQKKVCQQCGSEVQDDQAFCSSCGQKVTDSIGINSQNAIKQFNANLEREKNKSRKTPIIIAIVVAVCVAIGLLTFNIISSQNAEKAKAQYLENASEFLSLSLTAGTNLEDISDTVQKYWYENIWEDKHGYDINDAIRYALRDMSDEITTAETHNTRMESLYTQLKTVPSSISDEERAEIDEICSAIKDLYNTYTDFYSLATNPSGNYNSYRDDNNDTTDEFLSDYRALENLLK